jgi:hypothetical protein
LHIVTGMHRSGTSFLAQLLHYLGADFGDLDHLFPADKWNQKGYFENIDIIDANNRMILGPKAKIDFWLRENETRFSRIKNGILSRKWKYFYFPSLEGINCRAKNWEAVIDDLHVEYQNKFVKDPRFCLTLNAWRQRGPIERLIFSYRHPSLVAGSVARREGLPLVFGYRYWLYHVRNFFRQLHDGEKLFLVDFDLFFDTQTQERAFIDVAEWLTGEPIGMDQMKRLQNVLDIRLRSQAKIDAPPKVVGDVYEALKILSSKENGNLSVNLRSDLIKTIICK